MSSVNTNYVSYLIELAQSGRRAAFFDLCEINLKNIYTLAARLMPDAGLARKITLNTFLSAWENITLYTESIPFALWIKGISVRLIIVELEKEFNYDGQQTATPHSLKQSKLENLILALPPVARIIFVLHDVEGYGYEEIKQFLESLSVDEIKTVLIETRELLMDELEL